MTRSDSPGKSARMGPFSHCLHSTRALDPDSKAYTLGQSVRFASAGPDIAPSVRQEGPFKGSESAVERRSPGLATRVYPRYPGARTGDLFSARYGPISTLSVWSIGNRR